MSATTPILLPILSLKNTHKRDGNLVFDEPTHKYTIVTDIESAYTSVTTWNHQHFPHFDADKIIKKMMAGANWNSKNKYWGKTADQIKDGWSQNGAAVSALGTALHYRIECFMNEDLEYDDGEPCDYTHEQLLEVYDEMIAITPMPAPAVIEWDYFIQFVKDHQHLKPYRTEWMIYDDDLKLAGSIDMVYENEDGTLSIYDWKRAKEIMKYNYYKETATNDCIKWLPNTNYWHYSLQLNTYKAILERKYGKIITSLYLVRLHPNAKSYELIKCANLTEEVNNLFEERLEYVRCSYAGDGDSGNGNITSSTV